ncbi:putative galacturonosyltransferase 9 [Iris pallida]|uniref:Hexosyltransferase n=1 Tax=Iris pallida TaxID=29817 RepID=A0AAX6F223_IRIPA|nr:putative galacturonosyltransferase 9 [Iris pallida]
MAGGRRGGPMGLQSFFSYRVLVSAIFTLLFLASLSLFLSSKASTPSSSSSSEETTATTSTSPLPLRHLTFLSPTHRSRLSVLRRHAADHAALAQAYASFARKLKLSSSRQLHTFESLSLSFSDLASRISSSLPVPLDDDSLRPFEKELKEKIKLARQLISESKESFDTQLKIQKLKDTIFAVQEQLHKAKKLGSMSSAIAAGSTPKSLHCLNMRLMGEMIADPKRYSQSSSSSRRRIESLSADPDLLHYAVFSNNVIAVSVVVGSAVRNSKAPSRLVFHVVTDPMYVAAMKVWFVRRPPPSGASVDVRSVAEFAFLNSSYSPLVGRRDLVVLDYLRFYLPEMFPKLKRIILLEDDVVVQRDLSGLWAADLDGKVNGAVEMCFGPFRRFGKYMNFSRPEVKEGFSPRACAWGFGVNVFDLDAWRRERSTERFHRYLNLNEDGSLWNPGTVLPAGLMTFYKTTKPLEKSWHVMGLGYNPSVSQDEIHNAAVIHFNGNMKPWLDVALNQYKHLWSKYVDTEMEFLPLCNFGL